MANENNINEGNTGNINKVEPSSPLIKLINSKSKDMQGPNNQGNAHASISETQDYLRKEIDSKLSLQVNLDNVASKISGVELRQNIKNQYINIYKLNSEQFAKSKIILDSYCEGSKQNSLLSNSCLDITELTGDELKHAIRDQYVNIYRLDNRQFLQSKMKLDHVMDRSCDTSIREIVIKSVVDVTEHDDPIKPSLSKNTDTINIKTKIEKSTDAQRKFDTIDHRVISSPYSLVLEESTIDASSLSSAAINSINSDVFLSISNSGQRELDSNFNNTMDAIEMFTPRAVDITNSSFTNNEPNYSKSKLLNLVKHSAKKKNNFREQDPKDKYKLKRSDSQLSEGDAANPLTIPLKGSLNQLKEDFEFKELTMLQAITNKYEECGTNIYIPKKPRKTGKY